jgi:hypothetical protein
MSDTFPCFAGRIASQRQSKARDERLIDQISDFRNLQTKPKRIEKRKQYTSLFGKQHLLVLLF